MSKLQRYLDSIQGKILAEAAAELLAAGLDPSENHEALDQAVEGITDEYGQGFCDDQSARQYGDYPYDGSMDQGDSYPDQGERC